MLLSILAVVIQGKSIRFEGKKNRFSFGTVTADKKRHLEDLVNGELNGGVFNGSIEFGFFFLFYDRVVG